jgi:hypothetical protein
MQHLRRPFSNDISFMALLTMDLMHFDTTHCDIYFLKNNIGIFNNISMETLLIKY